VQSETYSPTRALTRAQRKTAAKEQAAATAHRRELVSQRRAARMLTQQEARNAELAAAGTRAERREIRKSHNAIDELQRRDALQRRKARQAAANAARKAELASRPLWYRIVRGWSFWVILALIVALCLMSGLSFIPIKTGSMRPGIQPGDIVVVVKSDLVKPQVGSIVVATPRIGDEQLPPIAHRIISINPDGTIKTKGDYNPEPDAWRVQPQEVQKTVVAIIPMGWARNPLNVAGALGLFALFLVWPSKYDDDDDDEYDDGSSQTTTEHPDDAVTPIGVNLGIGRSCDLKSENVQPDGPGTAPG
jgi:signal peptidase I